MENKFKYSLISNINSEQVSELSPELEKLEYKKANVYSPSNYLKTYKGGDFNVFTSHINAGVNLDFYNKELFLAIAAIREDDNDFYPGEYVCLKEDSQDNRKIMRIDTVGDDRYHYNVIKFEGNAHWGTKGNFAKLSLTHKDFRKMTPSELIKHFQPKTTTMETQQFKVGDRVKVKNFYNVTSAHGVKDGDVVEILRIDDNYAYVKSGWPIYNDGEPVIFEYLELVQTKNPEVRVGDKVRLLSKDKYTVCKIGKVYEVNEVRPNGDIAVEYERHYSQVFYKGDMTWEKVEETAKQEEKKLIGYKSPFTIVVGEAGTSIPKGTLYKRVDNGMGQDYLHPVINGKTFKNRSRVLVGQIAEREIIEAGWEPVYEEVKKEPEFKVGDYVYVVEGMSGSGDSTGKVGVVTNECGTTGKLDSKGVKIRVHSEAIYNLGQESVLRAATREEVRKYHIVVNRTISKYTPKVKTFDNGTKVVAYGCMEFTQEDLRSYKKLFTRESQTTLNLRGVPVTPDFLNDLLSLFQE